MAVNPTAHSLACLRIGVFVTADAARLATGVGGAPFTGRVSHPLDGEQSFMTSPHRHSPLTSLAWSHCAPTPRRELESACVRGDERLSGWAPGWTERLERRVHASHVSGHALPRSWRPNRRSAATRRDDRGAAARAPRHPGDAQRARHGEASWQLGARRADLVLRACLPHAGLRAGGGRHSGGIRRHQKALRPRRGKSPSRSADSVSWRAA